MPIGSRQLVLLTHMAMQWPRRIHSLETKKFKVQFCKHPVIPGEQDNRRDCHCWQNMPTSIISIFDSLKDRGFIDSMETQEDDESKSKSWQLTPEGWRVLDAQKRAPVRVRTWRDTGLPMIYTVYRSKRAEFEVLYWKTGWGQMNSWITRNKLALYILEETT